MTAALQLRFQAGTAAGAAGTASGPALDIDLALPLRGISALTGPSGSGKTTCLRVIAGLEQLPGARVMFGDETWQDGACFVPPHRRALGYVFQEASLFAHLTVADNLAFGRRRAATRARPPEAERIIEMLGIGGLLGRRPDRLSGGERQRVAIARALLAAPRLLLMDEPLAALDAARKQEILPYLERLRDALSLPIVYVSHAADEVARLASHLVLLDGGRVRAIGPSPGAPAVAAFDAVLAAQEDDGLSRLDFPGGTLRIARRSEALGTRVRCQILARDVSLSLARPAASTALNLLPARVTGLAAAGPADQVLIELQAGQVLLRAQVAARSVRALGIAAGAVVWAQVNTVTLL